MHVELTCAFCGTSFKLPPSRIRTAQKRGTYPKFCTKACANIGQARNPWAKGLTKETDERLQRISTSVQTVHQTTDTYRGSNHWARRSPLTPEQLKRLERNFADARGWPSTPSQLAGLKMGHGWGKGLTKENDPSIARRSKKLSESQKGTKRPEHSERMKKFYDEHPERNPHFIQASKDHETGIERIMRQSLEAENIPFDAQYRIGRFCIDFAIPSHRLAIEVDGEYWHRVRAERDALRDAALLAKGWRTIRFSEYRINQDIHQCISEIRELLSLGDPQSVPKQLRIDF